MNGHPAGTGQVRLSRRELEVARLVAEGLTNRDISKRLFVSERTIDGHLEHVREKLGVNSRAQVAAWVTRLDSGEAVAPASAAVQSRPSQVDLRRLRALVAGALAFGVLALGFIGIFREPPSPTIITVAGTQPVDPSFDLGTYSGDDGPATSAELARPSAIAIGGDGVVYIADFGNLRIRKVGPDRIIRTVAGGGKSPVTEGTLAVSAHFAFPSTVVVGKDNRIYVLTNEGGHLEVWSVGSGPYVKLEVALPATGYHPASFWPDPVGGLALAKDGSLYIADTAADRVWLFSHDSLSLVGGVGEPGFSGDTGPATTALLDSPVGLALDETRGYLYIADVGNDRIRRVNLNSRVITTFAGSGDTFGDSGDGGPANAALLKIPFGVAVAPDGTVYIADTGNNRIRKVTPSGVIVGVAGTGTNGFAGDGGPAGQALLSGPEAVAVAPNGDLLIADTFNARVRKVLHTP